MKTLLTLTLLALLPLMARAEKRVALVIGCGTYGSAGALPNPTKDAALLTEKLTALQFNSVLNFTDVNAKTFNRKLEEFKTAAFQADVAVFYFAGHGVEVDDVNYMLPTDAVLEEAADLKQEAISLPDVLKLLTDAQVKAKVVILDCCRNNPFASGPKERGWMRTRAVGPQEGLAEVKANLPQGTVIMLSAAPGKKAKDGPVGGNSPFATALAATLGLAGKDGKTPENVFETMMNVSDAVIKTTGGKQEPWLKFDGQPQLLRNLAFAPVALGPIAMRPRIVEPPPAQADPLDNPQNEAGRGLIFTVAGPNGDVKLTIRSIPSGSFLMGSPSTEADRSEDEAGADGKPIRTTFSDPFWLMETEATQSLYAAVNGDKVSTNGWQAYMEKQKALDSKNSYGDVTGVGPNQPMYFVSAEEADAFIGKLNQKVSLGAKWKWALPREAQWEYACRAGAGNYSVFSFGNTLNGIQANCDGTYPYPTGSAKGKYLKGTCDVGSYSPNEWGLKDMHGNVWEWCQDRWDGSSPLPGGSNPLGASGSFRVFRGGGWYGLARYCRSADRDWGAPTDRFDDLGFRCAAVPVGSQ